MSTWISDKFKLNSWIVPQVQVPKGYGKGCSRSHSRAVMIAYHQIQNACRATGAHATHCLDYFTIRLFTYIFTIYLIFFCTLSCILLSPFYWTNMIMTKQPSSVYSVVYSATCYTSPGVGSSAVRNSLNFTPAHWLIKRELLFIQRMKGCR